MRFLSLLAPLLALWAQHVLASPRIELPPPILQPQDDPFYKPEGDWQSKDLGTILDVRKVTIASLLPYAPSKAKAYQLLYRTQNVHGHPDASVTTIIIPAYPNFKRVLSVQNAYDSADANCGPSYGLQYRAKGWAASWNQMNLAFMLRYLQAGPIMNIPDYEGSNATFTVGPTSAFQTLDSIRAVLNSVDHPDINPSDKISRDAKVIMFGYSGGAFATEWATEKVAWYASELKAHIVGAVMGGAPPNVVNTYHNANKGDLSELNVAAVLGVMNAFPEIDAYLRNDLVEETKDLFLSALTKCYRPCEVNSKDIVGADVSAFFKNGDSFLTIFKDTLDDIGVMGKNISFRNAPGYPLMFFYGDQDEIIAPISDTVKLANKWILMGLTSVKRIEIANATHMSGLAGLPRAWLWIDAKFRKAERKKGAGETLKDREDDIDEFIENPEEEMSRIEAQLSRGLVHEL